MTSPRPRRRAYQSHATWLFIDSSGPISAVVGASPCVAVSDIDTLLASRASLDARRRNVTRAPCGAHRNEPRSDQVGRRQPVNGGDAAPKERQHILDQLVRPPGGL